MGSSQSAPVEKAKDVTVEDHHNLIEIQMDHAAMAVGTAIAIVILFLVCRRCKKRRNAG